MQILPAVFFSLCFLEHSLFRPENLSLSVVLYDEGLTVLPDGSDVHHLDVEVEVATQKEVWGVYFGVFGGGTQRAKLRSKECTVCNDKFKKGLEFPNLI